ncbi:PREDICTED: uncharacterized protein LOC109230296 [Nicotiana attenuata]|uniref:uncharacterized protein LOC109230296 n=1 Tax=Nicotiana attenuata TaxID=49451 RepID=UPI0009046071|nr:PREDICTED: uncharacterized protein LOC109230296 [Nicotiana attenuata]
MKSIAVDVAFLCLGSESPNKDVGVHVLFDTAWASADVDECSYPVELYDILDKKVLFKVTVKSSNIKVHQEIYNVVKISKDDNLIQQYSQSAQDDTFTDPDFECQQHTDADTTFKDPMAENVQNIKRQFKAPTLYLKKQKGQCLCFLLLLANLLIKNDGCQTLLEVAQANDFINVVRTIEMLEEAGAGLTLRSLRC